MSEIGILCNELSHEFVYQRDGFYYIGVTEVVLNELKEIFSVEFPKISEVYTKGEIFACLEADNAAVELFMPITGKVEEINLNIKENPKLLKTQSIENNWLIKISSDFYNEDKKDLILYSGFSDGRSATSPGSERKEPTKPKV